ncbi:MAG: aspartate aminotransferase family protein [Eubacterium sp.]|nr:aspartate aminotransferase family protein [Eubacterium sp.]
MRKEHIMQDEIAKIDEHLIHAYKRYPVIFDHGEDVYLFDIKGKKYLDFGGGIAVCALGYSCEPYKEALKKQIDKGIHFSNYFYSEPLREAAENICEISGMDKVFFCNSGSEANEGALKLARKYAILNGHEHRHEIVSMDKAFHGRSMGALSVTGTKKYREPYEPMLAGVSFATYNDLDSVKALVTDNTYAIIVEALQGEGGIYPAEPEFIRGIREICDENDIIMICDEVQCGMGRSGKAFAFEHYGIRPDIMTMAKGIGGGITVGAFAAPAKVADCMVPGDHGTTFGGNPLSMAAINATIDQFKKQNLIAHVAEIGEYLGEKLQSLVDEKEICVSSRGLGLMRGLELSEPAAPYVSRALEEGLVLMAAGTHVIRFVPPLVIEKQHVDEMIGILRRVF